MNLTFEQIRNKALKLISDLQKNCNDKTILTYQETNYILDILYKVKDIDED